MEESQWEQKGNVNSAKAHKFGRHAHEMVPALFCCLHASSQKLTKL